MKLGSHKFKIKFVLAWTLFFFVFTYGVVNKSTISDQIDVIVEGSKVFLGTTSAEVLNSNRQTINLNDETFYIEQKIFNLVNEIRSENELEPVLWDPMLAKVARQHSKDMVANHYFNHTDLLGQGPTERAKVMGIRTVLEVKDMLYIGLSENIGIMPRGIVQDVGILITSDDIAAGMVYSWMMSEPHKENILEDNLFFTGIGVVYDGNGNYYITQNFQ